MLSFVASALLAASVANTANAECANACNGHGKCTAYDMCICNRNWQGNDCNQRVCHFGLAHVDTPKGDLDMSGGISGPDHIVVDNHPVYPYGTTEKFPQMEDSDLTPLTHSGHYYMECSNKGSCNRQSGECQCFEGYDGVACERASCPGFPASCSGHGTCKTISQLAQADNGNVYKLWDRYSTMGCDCDPGYYGPDCSLRDCKHGVDPLYLDDAATAKVGIYDFAVLTTGTGFTNGFSTTGTVNPGTNTGEWAIRFFDSFGEDWLTTAIPSFATCTQVTDALYALPNDVIPSGSVECNNLVKTSTLHPMDWTDTMTTTGRIAHTYNLYYRMALWHTLAIDVNTGGSTKLPSSWVVSGSAATNKNMIAASGEGFVGNIYRLKFTQNPGALKEPQIELYLDGKRPSLVGTGSSGTLALKVVTFVTTDGQQGEDNDYFANHCDGVTVTINAISGAATTDYVSLGGLTTAEGNLLKSCLGDSDGDMTNNVEVYNWDYGSAIYPHLIKLVRTVTSYRDGGYYAALWYDASTFKLVNPFIPPDGLATDTYDVYTTKGILKRTSATSQAYFGYGEHHLVTASNAQQSIDLSRNFDTRYSGSLSCELEGTSTTNVLHCLNATDIFTILDFTNPQANAPYINLYTVKRIWTTEFVRSVAEAYTNGASTNTGDSTSNDELRRGTNVIETDLALNWGGSDWTYDFHVYKFVPDASSTYNYVAPCSNRGICNTDNGICQCFPGYTSDDCSVQNSLAL